VERIIEPREADYAKYPWRISWCLLGLLLSVAVFVSLRALLVNLMHHASF
jgi:hypothetical protein